LSDEELLDWILSQVDQLQDCWECSLGEKKGYPTINVRSRPVRVHVFVHGMV